MSDILHGFTDAAIITAIEENLTAFLLYGGTVPGAIVQKTPYFTSVLTPTNNAFRNAVIGAHLPEHGLNSRIADILLPFKTHKKPMLWWIFPSTTPASIEQSLAAHGLSYRGEGSGMAVSLDTLPDAASVSSELVILEVQDQVALQEWLRIGEVAANEGLFSPDSAMLTFETALGFGSHLPYRRYLGILDGRPVSSSLLFLGADVAGLYNVAALPSVRDQDSEAALTLKTLQEAHKAGYQVAVAISSAAENERYIGSGFRGYCRFRTYLWQPLSDAFFVDPDES